MDVIIIDGYCCRGYWDFSGPETMKYPEVKDLFSAFCRRLSDSLDNTFSEFVEGGSVDEFISYVDEWVLMEAIPLLDGVWRGVDEESFEIIAPTGGDLAKLITGGEKDKLIAELEKDTPGSYDDMKPWILHTIEGPEVVELPDKTEKTSPNPYHGILAACSHYTDKAKEDGTPVLRSLEVLKWVFNNAQYYSDDCFYIKDPKGALIFHQNELTQEMIDSIKKSS